MYSLISFLNLLVLSFLLVLLFLLINYFLVLCYLSNSGYLLEVECGFESLGSYHNSMSLGFIKFLVVFLVFELELVVLIPFVGWVWMFSLDFFVLFILLVFMSGLIVEWLGSFLVWV